MRPLALGGALLIAGVVPAAAEVPNAQAIVEQTAHFYLNQGALGAMIVVLAILLVVAGYMIRSLYNANQALNAAALTERNQIIAAQAATATAADKMAHAMDSLRAALDASKDASEDLTKQVELTAQETRHSLANLLSAVNGLVNRADRGRS